MRNVCVVAVVVGLLVAGVVFAADPDWSGWRGPDRNGVAAQSPALVDQFPDKGPTRLWESEDLFDKGSAGSGSAVAADGKTYVFADWEFDVPIDERILSKGTIAGWGYNAEMPEDLSKAVEEARMSDARKALKNDKELNDWIAEWLKEHLTPEQKKFQGTAQARLRAGANALPIDVLAKLATIADRKFENQAELDKWFADNGVDDKLKKSIMQGIPQTKKDAKDFVFCFDAGTGKTDWKQELSAQWMWYAGSSTPAVANGKVYVLGSDAKVACLDAKTGAVAWQSESVGNRENRHNRSSSVLVADGKAFVVTEQCTAGIDAATGRVIWRNSKVRSEASSPVLWRKGDKSYVITNGDDKIACLDPEDGNLLWDVPSGSSATSPVITGDTMVFCGGEKVGLIAYKLAGEKPTQLWTLEFKDSHTSPLVWQGHVYISGGAANEGGKGRIVCVDLATGAVKWQEIVGPAELSSPILADGKIFAIVGPSIFMVKASPEKYELLGKANLGLDKYTSPAIADGKLLLRTAKKVLCFDVKKQ